MVRLKRGLTAALCVASAAIANASYELLLVADNGNASVTPRVHRFDPVSRAYLGSFGEGILSAPKGVEISPDGTAWVADVGDRVRLFNAYTGVYLGVINYGILSQAYGRLVGDSYWATRSTGLNRIHATTYAVSNPPATSGGTLFIAPINSNEFIAGTGFSQISRFNGTTGALISSQGISTSFINAFADAVLVPGALGSTTFSLVVGRTFDVTNDLTIVNMNASLTVTSSTTRNVSSLNNVFGLAKAHRGFYAAGTLATDATKGGVTFFDEELLERYTFGSNVIISPRGMAAVIAPEPATFAALGLGVLALMRRRRR